MRKVKLLVTDTAPLYPPLWGGPKRIWNLYSNFSQELFDITYVGVDINIRDGLKYKFNKISDNLKEINTSLPAYHRFWHTIEKSVFKNSSLDLFIYLQMHTYWHFKHMLNSQAADVVICSHPWSTFCVKNKPGQVFIYDAHNCEYFLMDQILGRHPLKLLVLERVKAIEREACRRSSFIVVCSEKEKQDLMLLYNIPENKFHLSPNGTTIRETIKPLQRQASRKELLLDLDKKVVFFVGAYYKPNIDAVRFIIRELAPALQDFTFLVAGTVGDAFRGEQVPENIKLLGGITEEKLNTCLSATDMAINPMFEGSGINIKMLDYMSYGLPIVTTPVGARGIETNRRKPMLVSGHSQFAETIKKLSPDSSLRESLSSDARNLAKELYEWKTISKKLENIVIQTIESKIEQ